MVSVVIPTYNRGDTIIKSVQSVLSQTYQDLEVIVVDDCSEDDTEKIVRQIADPRVSYIRLEKNGGACVARNTGIDAARGDFIAFQDSDDSWRENKLEIQMSLLKEYDADICFGKIQRHNFPKNAEKVCPNLQRGIIDYSTLIMHSLVSTQTVFAKSEICKEFHFDPSMKRMQDYDWIIRAGYGHRVVFSDDILADVYLLSDSITSFDRKKLFTVNEIFLEKYKYLFVEYPEFEATLLDGMGHYRALLGDLKGNEFKKAYKLSGDKKFVLKNIIYKMGFITLYYKTPMLRLRSAYKHETHLMIACWALCLIKLNKNTNKR